MQVEFAFAASSAAAVATHQAWFVRSAKTMFTADQKVQADGAVNGIATGMQSLSAGSPKARPGHVACFDAAGRGDAKGGPKRGVMTYDARKAGRKVQRAGVAANVTRSC
ncbi:MAG: hypothetical protein LBV73_20555 [Paraburkholderia sp.]|jgi:hypothetical protein|nr:hypothetical protein [Paraburkholderia sp.]